MKKRLSSTIILLLVTLLCTVIFAAPSFAAEMPDGALPVTVKLEGPILPDPEEVYLIRLRADDPAYPMPAGSVDSVYTLSISGAGSAGFPAISYDLVGSYTYTLYQEAGLNDTAVYDDTVYLLTVYVTNQENGDGLETQWVLRQAAAEGKQDAEFTNFYEAVLPVTPPLIEVEKLAQEKKFSKTGDLIHYSFTVKNVGLVPIVELVLNDAKLGIENMTLDKSAAPLQPGESMTIKATNPYEVTEADVEAMVIKNTVKVMAVSEEGLKSEAEADLTVPMEKIAPHVPLTGESRNYLLTIVLLSLGTGILVLAVYLIRKKYMNQTR